MQSIQHATWAGSRTLQKPASKWHIGMGLARAGAVALIAACALGAASPQTAPVRLDEALITKFAGNKSVTRPSHDATMGFAAATVVKEVLRHGGEEVKQGDLILRGDDAEEAALYRLQEERIAQPYAVERAKAAADLAKVEYERLRDVQAKGGSGTQEVERARLNAEVARIDHLTAVSNQTQEVIQLDRIRARVDRFHLTAPFNGVIDAVNVDVGQSVSERDMAVRVVSVDPLWMDVPAPMTDPVTLGLGTGDRAWVLCDVAGDARMFTGKVIEVAPTADPASRTRRVRVEMPNPAGPNRLIAGEPVWVRFTQPEGIALQAAQAGQATAMKKDEQR